MTIVQDVVRGKSWKSYSPDNSSEGYILPQLAADFIHIKPHISLQGVVFSSGEIFDSSENPAAHQYGTTNTEINDPNTYPRNNSNDGPVDMRFDYMGFK